MIDGCFFPKIRNSITATINNKNVTYSNSLLELWKERQYSTGLISVKSDKKGIVFFVAKTVKYTRNHCVKLANTNFQFVPL